MRHGLLLAIALVTQLTFPILYDFLTHDAWSLIPATLVLAMRNILLVYLTWWACRQVWLTSAVTPVRSEEPELAGRAA